MSAHRDYLFDLGMELKQLAQQARRDRDAAPQGSRDRPFHEGRLLAFHRVVSLMQQQAERGSASPSWTFGLKTSFRTVIRPEAQDSKQEVRPMASTIAITPLSDLAPADRGTIS